MFDPVALFFVLLVDSLRRVCLVYGGGDGTDGKKRVGGLAEILAAVARSYVPLIEAYSVSPPENQPTSSTSSSESKTLESTRISPDSSRRDRDRFTSSSSLSSRRPRRSRSPVREPSSSRRRSRDRGSSPLRYDSERKYASGSSSRRPSPSERKHSVSRSSSRQLDRRDEARRLINQRRESEARRDRFFDGHSSRSGSSRSSRQLHSNRRNVVVDGWMGWQAWMRAINACSLTRNAWAGMLKNLGKSFDINYIKDSPKETKDKLSRICTGNRNMRKCRFGLTCAFRHLGESFESQSKRLGFKEDIDWESTVEDRRWIEGKFFYEDALLGRSWEIIDRCYQQRLNLGKCLPRTPDSVTIRLPTNDQVRRGHEPGLFHVTMNKP